MRIAGVEIKGIVNGLNPFKMNGLERHVILSGENGTGKTRLLMLIVEAASMKIEENKHIKITYADDNGNALKVCSLDNLRVSNYSHSDLPLKSAESFPPYVINKSRENLHKEFADFSQTSRDALLYLTYLTRYAKDSNELNRFNEEYCVPILGAPLKNEEGEPFLFGHSVNELKIHPLSPGQKYLLRLCVALNCNIIQPGTVLFLDEPESHLHPKVLIELFCKLENRFDMGQIWISTHSVELISNFWPYDIWLMNGGVAKKVGSRSEAIIEKLIGNDDNRSMLRGFISSPAAYACNIFAAECLCSPDVVKEATPNDPSTGLVHTQLKADDVLVDYGAGKGRFLESYYMNCDRPHIQYIAYDKYGLREENGESTGKVCIGVMKEHNITEDNYFGAAGDDAGFDNLIESKGKCFADKVILVNVLHEISPLEWRDLFQKISRLLNNNGYLIIVEREELTIGERPFSSDFFVLQHRSLAKLFGCGETDFKTVVHDTSKQVTAHVIKRGLLKNVRADTIINAIAEEKAISAEKIKGIKQKTLSGSPDLRSWKVGIQLAFWTHQYANASLFDCNEIKKEENKNA